MNDPMAQARQHFLAGVTHFEAGELGQAERSFEAALALAPGRASVLANLGAARVRLGKFADALPLLEQVTVAEPGNADAWGHLGTACAESSGRDEVLTQQSELRQANRKRLGLRIGLSLMSIAVAGLQVGLTVPYRDQLPGQALATFGGVTSGLFMGTDIMLIANPPRDEGAASFFWPFPPGAAGIAIAVPSILLLMLPPCAGGAAAYATAQSPTGAVVSSSLSAAFSLASALALTWML